MEDALKYIDATAPATEGLFNLLNHYGWEKIRALVAITKSETRSDLDFYYSKYSTNDIARNIIAGSILQVAFVAIDKYAVPQSKSVDALNFESEVNRAIKENLSHTRCSKIFNLPMKFCVGRDIGDLPLGIIIYAGRNQYNHFYEKKRLSVLNEVVFNHLHSLYPESKNGISFDLHPNQLFSYSILAALGWTDSQSELGYVAYKRDMCDVLRIDL